MAAVGLCFWLLAAWPGSGRAQDFAWDFSCTPTGSWYEGCEAGGCPSKETLFQNN